MKVRYPPNTIGAEKRTGVIYRLQELLRLEHNIKGKTLSAAKFREYILTEFNPKSDVIVKEILENRALMKNDKEIPITLKNGFIE